MAASLAWLKVVDGDHFRSKGGQVTPGLENIVQLVSPAPAEAAPFFVLRAWSGVNGAFAETWRIEDPNGRTVHEGIERQIMQGMGSAASGGISDEVAGQVFEYADEGYQVVVEIEGREVARADFEVRDASEPITTP